LLAEELVVPLAEEWAERWEGGSARRWEASKAVELAQDLVQESGPVKAWEWAQVSELESACESVAQLAWGLALELAAGSAEESVVAKVVPLGVELARRWEGGSVARLAKLWAAGSELASVVEWESE